MVLLPIFLIVLVDVFAMTLVIPLLAIYAESLRASPLQATLLVSTFAACQLVSGPLLGRASDRFGRKPLLIISQLGTFAGLVLMAKATSLWMLFVARAIDGATAGNLTLAQASIADNTPPERRARSFALIGIAFGLGFFVGPFVTAELSRYGLTAPIWFAAAMSALSVVLTTFLLPAKRPEGVASQRVLDPAVYARYFAHPEIGPRLGEFFFYIFSFSTFTSGFALFAERRYGWSPRQIGYMFALSGALGIILQGGLIGRLVKRYGEAKLVVAGFLACGVSYGLLGASADVERTIALTLPLAFGNGVLRPALTSLISRGARPEEQGTVLGLSQSLSSLAMILAPLAGGILIEKGLLDWWAWLAGAVSLAGLLWGMMRA